MRAASPLAAPVCPMAVRTDAVAEGRRRWHLQRLRPDRRSQSLLRSRAQGSRDGDQSQARLGHSALAVSSLNRPGGQVQIELRLRDRAAGCRPRASDDGVDPISVSNGVVKTLEHDRRRAFSVRADLAQAGSGEHRSDVRGQVDGPDDRRVEFSALKPVAGDLQGLESGGLIARDREARAADPELAGDPAGDQPSQRTHRAIGRQGRTDRRAHRLNPLIQFIG